MVMHHCVKNAATCGSRLQLSRGAIAANQTKKNRTRFGISHSLVHLKTCPPHHPPTPAPSTQCSISKTLHSSIKTNVTAQIRSVSTIAPPKTNLLQQMLRIKICLPHLEKRAPPRTQVMHIKNNKHIISKMLFHVKKSYISKNCSTSNNCPVATHAPSQQYHT